MAKIIIKRQIEPIDSPSEDYAYFYVDDADGLLTLKLSTGAVTKYLTSKDIDLEDVRSNDNTVEGDIDMNTNTLINVSDPVDDQDVATKAWVESHVQSLSWLEKAHDFYDPTSGLPATPLIGERWISSATANGWIINYIYEYNGSTWDEIIPTDGEAIVIYDPDPDVAYVYDGVNWENFGTVITHSQLSGLQGGLTDEYYHLTFAQHTDLIDGGNSNLHYHSTDRDRTNHTGTQLASTISDFDTEVSNNVDVSANTTHRSSDGKNHSDVVLNNTHRTSDGKDHSDVVLNNTHRSSNGTDHSNVVLNDTHRTTVTGNPHNVLATQITDFDTEVENNTDVTANTTHRSSDGKDHSDVVLNNAHRISNGSDHTYINQDVKTTASPIFAGITTDLLNINSAGKITYDGKNITPTTEVHVKSISDFPAAVGGIITLAENTIYIGDNLETNISVTDKIKFTEESRIVNIKLTMSDSFTVDTGKNFDIRDSDIIYTGTGTLFDMVNVGKTSILLRVNIISSSTGTIFNINSTDPNAILIIQVLAIAGNSNTNLGTISDVFVNLTIFRVVTFGSGLSIDDVSGAIIETYISFGSNASTTHLTFSGAAIGSIQMREFIAIIQSNEYAFYFDPLTSFSSNVIVTASSISGTVANVFQSGSYDNTTIGFKFTGNLYISDSTVSSLIRIDTNTLDTSIPAINALVLINANTWANTQNERITVDSNGIAQYNGVENKKLDITTSLTLEPATGVNIEISSHIYIIKHTDFIVTFTNGTNLINETGTTLNNGDKISFYNTPGILPAELREDIIYYVVNKLTNSFQVSYTEGGTAITFTDDGTPTNSYNITTNDSIRGSAGINSGSPRQITSMSIISVETNDKIANIVENTSGTQDIEVLIGGSKIKLI
jgi:hypothetical protein